MKAFFLFLSYLALAVFAAGEAPLKVFSKEYVAVPRDDQRVTVEAVLTVESKNLLTPRSDSLFFIPYAAATEEERSNNRSIIEEAVYTPRDGSSSGYMAVGIATQVGVSLSLWAYDKKGQRDVDRKGHVIVPLLEDTRGEVAGIVFSVVWKKRPNQPLKPTAPSRRG